MAVPDFDRLAAIQKFIDYLNNHRPYFEQNEVEELKSEKRNNAVFLIGCGIPQILDESDTENDSSDGSGSANTTTIHGRQREQIIRRLQRWLTYLMTPQIVNGQHRYAYPSPKDASHELMNYFRVFGITKDEYRDWLRPVAPDQPVEQQ